MTEEITNDPSEHHLSGVQKFLLFVGAVACYVAWYFIAGQVNIPPVPHFSTSLLEYQPTLALITVAIAIPILSVLASLITFRVRTESGLFCSAVGLSFLAARSGDIRTILLTNGTPAVFMNFCIELLFLSVIVLASGELLNKLSLFGFVAEPAQAPKDDPDTTADRLTVIVGQTVCMLVLMMLLGQAPVKGQAMASICAASLVSTIAIQQSFKVRGSMWYLIGTMLSGLIGYAYCYTSGTGYSIGEISGLLAGSARSIPLHYASLGTAGTIYGYWISLSWHASREELLANA